MTIDEYANIPASLPGFSGVGDGLLAAAVRHGV